MANEPITSPRAQIMTPNSSRPVPLALLPPTNLSPAPRPFPGTPPGTSAKDVSAATVLSSLIPCDVPSVHRHGPIPSLNELGIPASHLSTRGSPLCATSPGQISPVSEGRQPDDDLTNCPIMRRSQSYQGSDSSSSTTAATAALSTSMSVHETYARKRGSNNNVWSDHDARKLLHRILHNLDEYHRANKTSYYREVAEMLFDNKYTEAQVKNKITSLKKGYSLAKDAISQLHQRNPPLTAEQLDQEVRKIRLNNCRHYDEIDRIFSRDRQDRPDYIGEAHTPASARLSPRSAYPAVGRYHPYPTATDARHSTRPYDPRAFGSPAGSSAPPPPPAYYPTSSKRLTEDNIGYPQPHHLSPHDPRIHNSLLTGQRGSAPPTHAVLTPPPSSLVTPESLALRLHDLQRQATQFHTNIKGFMVDYTHAHESNPGTRLDDVMHGVQQLDVIFNNMYHAFQIRIDLERTRLAQTALRSTEDHPRSERRPLSTTPLSTVMPTVAPLSATLPPVAKSSFNSTYPARTHYTGSHSMSLHGSPVVSASYLATRRRSNSFGSQLPPPATHEQSRNSDQARHFSVHTSGATRYHNPAVEVDDGGRRDEYSAYHRDIDSHGNGAAVHRRSPYSSAHPSRTLTPPVSSRRPYPPLPGLTTREATAPALPYGHDNIRLRTYPPTSEPRDNTGSPTSHRPPPDVATRGKDGLCSDLPTDNGMEANYHDGRYQPSRH
ncbi:hypothetical protein IWQ60_004283 [Tieghemiomyces parasiticus]|uniref:Uncharacterized protein n=1 Tax=Tieghemiomyces parasiticus TaxID=78921 RepID=A0A9W8DZX6_9FUNG|nr:hypothetical protein IWQ60_004283 [Tieghemiomyces parasiticus]